MRLTPIELDRLTIFTAAELARRRQARGLKLSYPEAVALICDAMHEAARDGAAYDEVVRIGQSTLTLDDVLDGVPELVGTIKLECLFGDGMRVLQVEQPIRAAPLPPNNGGFSGVGDQPEPPRIGGQGATPTRGAADESR